jgi:hypothetical protein
MDDRFQKLIKINDNETNYEIVRNNIEKDENGNICSTNSAWFLFKQSKMNIKVDKYKIHQGEIIKIGRIILRIKEIRFNKDINKDCKSYSNNSNNNNTKCNNNSINSSKHSSNKFKLRDIEDEIILKNFDNKDLNNEYHGKIIDLVNQRNPTDSNFQDKIQILSLNNNNSKLKITNKSIKNNLSVNSKTKSKEKICRICYMAEGEDDETTNPIIQPCHCSGSCKYIHLNCLKQWINTKNCLKIDQNDNCSVFIFTESECEICKTKFPDLIEYNGKLHSLLDFSDEFNNYLILESLTLDRQNNKFLYIISLDKNAEIKMGRGEACDILLSDISVSRIHSVLIIEGKNIYLQDNDSKFGTLILIQTPTITMAEGLPLYIQVGRTYLNLLATKKKNLFSCCGISEVNNFLYYHKQNEREIETNRFFTVKTQLINDSEIEDTENNNEIKNDEKNNDEKNKDEKNKDDVD